MGFFKPCFVGIMPEKPGQYHDSNDYVCPDLQMIYRVSKDLDT